MSKISSTNIATILEIVRMSTEDGPGIRTTVFFKGCTLKCAWCHNPESISAKPQLQWVGSRCIGCKTCMEVCPENALTLTETGMQIDRNRWKHPKAVSPYPAGNRPCRRDLPVRF